MSHITTHVLDTSRGKPAAGILVTLSFQKDQWEQIASGITNADGRASDLLQKGLLLPAGIYQLKFETGTYFKSMGIAAFYPFVEIVFEVTSDSHYHVPLLLNPFGYSTYRGS